MMGETPSLEEAKVRQMQLHHMIFKWGEKSLQVDVFAFEPQDILMPLLYLCISVYYYHLYRIVFILNFSSIFLLFTLLNLSPSFSAASNRSYRLWPDGDDSQAVSAQAHHRWHQRLCPPHWLRPYQEGARRTLYIEIPSSFYILFPSVCVFHWISDFPVARSLFF